VKTRICGGADNSMGRKVFTLRGGNLQKERGNFGNLARKRIQGKLEAKLVRRL